MGWVRGKGEGSDLEKQQSPGDRGLCEMALSDLRVRGCRRCQRKHLRVIVGGWLGKGPVCRG